MRALVTGGSGFVGSNLLAALRDRRDEVRALARSEGAAMTVARAGAEPVRGDLHDDAALRAGMAGCDVVFHSAALLEFPCDREQAYRVNVEGTERLLAAARAAGVPRLVAIGAAASYLADRPLRNAGEQTPLSSMPAGPYSETKGLAQQRVLAANSPTLATMVVTPPAVWGVGDPSFLPEVARAARAGAFMWFDGGLYPVSTCHVRNVCEGAILAAERGRGGETYFLTDGPPWEFRRFVAEMLRTQGIEPPTRSVPRWLALLVARVLEGAWRRLPLPGRPPLSLEPVRLLSTPATFSDGKARRELGYTARVSREAGLAELRSSAAGSQAGRYSRP